MCASFTGGRHGTRMHYGKLETQCDALYKILLENLCAIHVATPLNCTTYLSFVAKQPCPTTFHGKDILQWLCSHLSA